MRILFVFLLWTCCSVAAATHILVFGKTNNVEAQYSTNGTHIEFHVRAQLGAANWYVGMGPSRDGKMAHSDVWLAWWQDGKLALHDCYTTTGHHRPNLLEHQDLTVLNNASLSADNVLTYSFQRKLVTGDGQDDIDLSMDKASPFIWALGEVSDGKARRHHHGAGSMMVSWRTGEVYDMGNQLVWGVHGTLMTVAWLVLVPFAVYQARFGKKLYQTEQWWPMHYGSAGGALVLTLTGFFLMFGNILKQGDDHFESLHAKLGLATVVLATAQGVLGLFAHLKYDPYRIRTPVFPDRLHAAVGSLVMLLAVACVVLGFKTRAQNRSKPALDFVVPGALCVLALLLHLVVLGALQRALSFLESQMTRPMRLNCAEDLDNLDLDEEEDGFGEASPTVWGSDKLVTKYGMELLPAFLRSVVNRSMLLVVGASVPAVASIFFTWK